MNKKRKLAVHKIEETSLQSSNPPRLGLVFPTDTGAQKTNSVKIKLGFAK